MSDDNTKRVEYRGTGFYVGLGAILLFALALLILAVQNTQDVNVTFLGWDFTIPLFGVAIGAALGAAVLDELIGLVWRRRRRVRLAERAELRSLRAAERSETDQADLKAASPELSTESGADEEKASDDRGSDEPG